MYNIYEALSKEDNIQEIISRLLQSLEEDTLSTGLNRCIVQWLIDSYTAGKHVLTLSHVCLESLEKVVENICEYVPKVECISRAYLDRVPLLVDEICVQLCETHSNIVIEITNAAAIFLKLISRYEKFQEMSTYLGLAFLKALCAVSAVERSKIDAIDTRRLLETIYNNMLEVCQIGICFETTAERTVRTCFGFIEAGHINVNRFAESDGLFYMEALSKKDLQISKIALDSIISLLTKQYNSKKKRYRVASFFVTEYPQTVFAHLLSREADSIVIRVLEIFSLIHGYFQFITSWYPTVYELAFHKIFGKSTIVRKLAGYFLIEICKRKHHGNDFYILKYIFEFYLQYNNSPCNLTKLVEAIWHYKYIQDFKNLERFITSPAYEDNVRFLVSHLAVEIGKKKLQDKEKYSECACYMEKLALLISDDTISSISRGILTRLFLETGVDDYRNIYTLESQKLKRVQTLFKSSAISTRHQRLFKNILSFFKVMKALGADDAVENIKEITENTLQNFLQIESDGAKGNLRNTFGKLSVLTADITFLDIETAYKFLEIIYSKYFEENFGISIFTKNDITSGLMVKAFSNLTQRIFLEALKTNHVCNTGLLRDCARSVIEFCTYCLQTEAEISRSSKYFVSLVDIILCTENSTLARLQKTLCNITGKKSQDLYGDFVRYVKDNCFEITSNKNLKEEVRTHLKNVLERLAMLVEYGVKLPHTEYSWEIMIYFAKARSFQTELEKFLRSFLLRSLEDTPKYNDFSVCLAKSLLYVNQCDGMIEFEKHLKIYSCFLKQNVPQDNEQIMVLSIKRILESLGQTVEYSSRSHDKNRLALLMSLEKYVKLFHPSNKLEIHKIRSISERNLSQKEKETWNNFRTSVGL